MKILSLLILLIPVSALALDKYVFRVPQDIVRPKSTTDSFFAAKGRKGTSQPFYQTQVLQDKDTSYLVINITPSDDTEDTSAKALFSIPGADLISIIRLEDGQEPRFIEDNRDKFPTNTDWSLRVSSK